MAEEGKPPIERIGKIKRRIEKEAEEALIERWVDRIQADPEFAQQFRKYAIKYVRYFLNKGPLRIEEGLLQHMEKHDSIEAILRRIVNTRIVQDDKLFRKYIERNELGIEIVYRRTIEVLSRASGDHDFVEQVDREILEISPREEKKSQE